MSPGYPTSSLPGQRPARASLDGDEYSAIPLSTSAWMFGVIGVEQCQPAITTEGQEVIGAEVLVPFEVGPRGRE